MFSLLFLMVVADRATLSRDVPRAEHALIDRSFAQERLLRTSAAERREDFRKVS
jgi:hypothetical protein